MGFFDNLWGGGDSSGGGGSALGNIFGAIQTGASIYNQYNQNQNSQNQIKQTNQLAQDKFAEEKRQFDLQHQLALAKLGMGGGGGGGGGGPDPRQMRSTAMQNAYQQIIDASLTGRSAEAAALSKIVDQLQKVPQLVR